MPDLVERPRLRAARPEDIPAIAELYAHHVLTGRASFEEVPPSTEEMLRRLRHVEAQGLPWQVAELEGAVAGYCYASPWHTRSAYRFTVQDSIYIDERFLNRGIGTALLGRVIEICTELGYRQMMAVIGDSANDASQRLHARLGFRTIGHALRVGVKFGRWLDVVYAERPLGEQSATVPAHDPVGWLPATDQRGN